VTAMDGRRPSIEGRLYCNFNRPCPSSFVRDEAFVDDGFWYESHMDGRRHGLARHIPIPRAAFLREWHAWLLVPVPTETAALCVSTLSCNVVC
jgi:hypothetical protein